MIVEISHLCNFMKFKGYHLCLAYVKDGEHGEGGYAASFTKNEPVMPDRIDSCGTYQSAIKKAAEKIFENDPEICKEWSLETLKSLYKIRD